MSHQISHHLAAPAITPVVERGSCAAGLAGLAIGGLVGTFEWPVVATFFGALLGTLVGLVTGALDGLVIAAIARRPQPAWVLRAVSGLVFLLGAVGCVFAFSPRTSAREAVGNVLISVATLLVGVWAGPPIARGFPPVEVRRQDVPVPLGRLYGRALLLGAAVGAGVGGVTGLVIGLVGYPPTAVFALIEGAILGGVSGVVLAVVLAGLVTLAGLRPRR